MAGGLFFNSIFNMYLTTADPQNLHGNIKWTAIKVIYASRRLQSSTHCNLPSRYNFSSNKVQLHYKILKYNRLAL